MILPCAGYLEYEYIGPAYMYDWIGHLFVWWFGLVWFNSGLRSPTKLPRLSAAVPAPGRQQRSIRVHPSFCVGGEEGVVEGCAARFCTPAYTNLSGCRGEALLLTGGTHSQSRSAETRPRPENSRNGHRTPCVQVPLCLTHHTAHHSSMGTLVISHLIAHIICGIHLLSLDRCGPNKSR